MSDWPTAIAFVVLALAAYRTTRLIGWDTVLDRPRDLLTRRSQAAMYPNRYRGGLDKWLHCAWCLGFWVSVAWWLVWEQWPEGTMVAATPFAISAVVGLVAKNLDP